ncbi:leucine-rich repeat and WD repeat-containing protein 1 isoform X2 [Nematostella vectensis]|uniref:leucine-rich repeat and WD repeat-containing protein 1 isoform X1 n=1 Tax=Nematostella vectensis TaxID=45351 RepID=UPI00138FB410|nr:leucine-rich repeat and WD repeat-containing protein 1 isoform X1 [Nematostella vectensis]XP_048583104.1 leucine-rich repeat and WD repeat-containing protein 1 isoform X2 [Nematostella vectensis]
MTEDTPETPLTAEKIREVSKASDLSAIDTLSLQGQGLSQIESEILQQLTAIEELDLSNNKLVKLQLQDVFLPSLTKLNLANNQLATLEGFTAFPNLVDLNITNNPKIEVSEKYKLVAVCPLLKLLDGKDVSMMRDAVARLDSTLVSKVAEVWKSGCRTWTGKPDGEVKRAYLDKLKAEVVCGPPMLKMYREFRLSVLGEEYYQKMLEGDTEESPTKKTKLSVNGEVLQSKKTNSDEKKDVKKRRHAYPADARFEVSHLLQTHSLNNNPDDRKTQVWGCQFEPDINNPGKTTSICATCGGDSVCFIDCSTGQVLKKYKQPGETFYCIAWSTVTADINGNKRKANLLAAGGSDRTIKIIEPTQLVCIEDIPGIKGVLESLLFHPCNSTWLGCAADDTITIWEIGLPSGLGYGTKSKLLLTLKSRTIVRFFAFAPHGMVVVGACDDGCYLWKLADMDPTNDKPRIPFGSLEFPGKRSVPLDCVQCLSDSLIATKRVQEGSICIWHSESNMMKNDFSLVLKVPWRKTETPFLKFSFILECEVLVAGDDQGCVWLYDMMRFTPYTEKQSRKYEVMEQTQILLCPNDSTKVFNQVCANTSLDYIVAVADTNVVCMWRRLEQGSKNL